MNTPTILSEQDICDAFLEANAVQPALAQELKIGRAIESAAIKAYAATLAQGVELEATFWHDDETGEVIAASMHGGGASFEALVPLSTAQAAVAAERAKAHRCKGLLREGCDYLASCGSICKKCGREHTLSIQSSPAPAAEPAMWQYRAYYDTCAGDGKPGWGAWEEVVPLNVYTTTVADRVREIQAYIEQGKRYELRALYATPSPQPAPTVPADRAGLVEECKRLAGEYATAVGQTVLAETEERSNARLAVATSLVRKLHAAIDRLASSAVQVPELPPLDDDLIAILGRPNFACHEYARLLRLRGHKIKEKAEHEQAAVLHFMLGFYFKYGPGQRWADEAVAAMRSAAPAAEKGSL